MYEIFVFIFNFDHLYFTVEIKFFLFMERAILLMYISMEELKANFTIIYFR